MLELQGGGAVVFQYALGRVQLQQWNPAPAGGEETAACQRSQRLGLVMQVRRSLVMFNDNPSTKNSGGWRMVGNADEQQH